MGKRFAVEHSTGFRQESSSCHEAANFQNYEGTRFFLRGSEVSAFEFFSAIAEAHEAWLDKKEQTHKRVRVLHGSSAACYVEKWVRK